MQIEVASRFSDFGTSAEDDRERDVVADFTVGGAVRRVADAGILSEVDVSRPMVAVFDRPRFQSKVRHPVLNPVRA